MLIQPPLTPIHTNDTSQGLCEVDACATYAPKVSGVTLFFLKSTKILYKCIILLIFFVSKQMTDFKLAMEPCGVLNHYYPY